ALLAAQHVLRSPPFRPGGQRRRVEVPSGLDERGASGAKFAAREGWQPAGALRFGAERDQRDGQEAGSEQVEREGSIAVGELLDQEHARQDGAGVSVAAECLGDGGLHEPELPASLDDLVRRLVALVGLAPVTTQDLPREARHRFADELLLVRRLEVHHVLAPPEAAMPWVAPAGASQVASASSVMSRVARRSISPRS